ncbi:UNVERIFIED_CONTAM: hypothetical protein FKN15_010836 [Acipenser sinensis]
MGQIGILVTLVFSIVAITVLSDLWSKEWTTLLLSFQYLKVTVNMQAAHLQSIVNQLATHCIEGCNVSHEKCVFLSISYDGVPFLMHDQTLKRTTNVHKVFPDRTRELASMFTLGELETLNAGEWFISGDPFGTKASLTVKDRGSAENQSIMNLSDFLNQAATHHKLVMFNLCRPPQDHPYRDSWINRTLEVISNESSIDPSLVLWLPNVERSLVQDLIPGMQQISEEQASIEKLQENNIVKLNLHYSQMSAKQIRKYAAANITTNLYVVSQPWLYSLAWCAGAHSVTTNAVQILKNLSQPLFLMTPHEYNLMWILSDVVSAVLIVLVFVFHWWRERGLPCFSGSRQTHENGPYSKFRTELSDVWSISSVDVPGEVRSFHTTPNLSTISEVHEPPV